MAQITVEWGYLDGTINSDWGYLDGTNNGEMGVFIWHK